MNRHCWVSPYRTSDALALVVVAFVLPVLAVFVATTSSPHISVFGVVALAGLFGLILSDTPKVYIERRGLRLSFWRAL